VKHGAEILRQPGEEHLRACQRAFLALRGVLVDRSGGECPYVHVALVVHVAVIQVAVVHAHFVKGVFGVIHGGWWGS
jgi:hypothetical protein